MSKSNLDYSNADNDKEKLISEKTVSNQTRIAEPVGDETNNPISEAAITSNHNTSKENQVDNRTNANANSDINLTTNAKVEDNVKTQSNVIENNNDTEKEPLCLMIQYDFNNPSDSKIKLCDDNTNPQIDGGKTQKKKRSLKPLKRKTIHKKLKFRKTPKKKHPRRRSIRK